ncbi:MAG: hypothetical protein AAGC64_05110, partial [Bacteroidota bacterium]
VAVSHFLMVDSHFPVLVSHFLMVGSHFLVAVSHFLVVGSPILVLTLFHTEFNPHYSPQIVAV